MTGHEAYVYLLEVYQNRLNEDNLSGYLNMVGVSDKNGDYGKLVRRMDVANSQLKRGAITSQQRDAIYNKLNAKAEQTSGLPILKSGSSSISKYTGARPNRTKSPMKPEDFGAIGNSYRHSTSVDPVTAEKLNRHLAIAQSTDNYNDYQQHRKQLMKMIGAPKDATLMPGAAMMNKTHFNGYAKSPVKNPNTATAKDGLYHTSNMKNIQALTPQFRSKDGALYPEQRVYFGAGNAMSRLGGSNASNVPTYKYTGKGTLLPDPESNSTGAKPGAFYLSTNRRLPVKPV